MIQTQCPSPSARLYDFCETTGTAFPPHPNVCSQESVSAVRLLEQREAIRTANSDLTRACPLPTPMHITLDTTCFTYALLLMRLLVYMPIGVYFLIFVIQKKQLLLLPPPQPSGHATRQHGLVSHKTI